MNLSDRDRPTCISEAGLIAAPPISPRSLKGIISNSTFGLPETFPGYAKILAVILSGTGQTFVIWRVVQRGGNDALDQKSEARMRVSEPLANT
jgi:hypothetical protein